MNETQVKQLVSAVVGIIGTVLTAKGLATTDQVGQFTSAVLSIVGPLMTIGALIYTAISHTASSQITATSQLPEVHQVVTSSDHVAQKVARPNVVSKFVDTTPTTPTTGTAA